MSLLYHLLTSQNENASLGNALKSASDGFDSLLDDVTMKLSIFQGMSKSS